MTFQIFEYLEEKASKVIDTSLLPFECLKNINELSGAIDVLIKCGFLSDEESINKAFDILEQVTTFADNSLPKE
ncbi:hypothetical protein [Acinetobacter seifertii]|uniref:Uncharacterized protein n=1 Tax=Acinetobacter seifertii TaxID=1530123 RepID=A0A7H2V2Z8_9GAMM|nr:hypothetical protein [Acinetobacter seifertii]MBZ6535520.1 hypothetical protein [Acinetobacter seifertii]QNX70731.1 hypothetical protein IC776_09460 [Acinetobacter seifertii]